MIITTAMAHSSILTCMHTATSLLGSPLNPSSAPQGKHCLLEAELSCVKDLLRREIYPIIIYVKISDKNVRKLR